MSANMRKFVSGYWWHIDDGVQIRDISMPTCELIAQHLIFPNYSDLHTMSLRESCSLEKERLLIENENLTVDINHFRQRQRGSISLSRAHIFTVYASIVLLLAVNCVLVSKLANQPFRDPTIGIYCNIPKLIAWRTNRRLTWSKSTCKWSYRVHQRIHFPLCTLWKNSIHGVPDGWDRPAVAGVVQQLVDYPRDEYTNET